MQAAEHPLEVPGSQYGGNAGGEEMRLSCFDARQDAQVGKLLAATRQVGGVALNVERRHAWPGIDARRLGDSRSGSAGELGRVLLAPLGEVDVLGERQPGRPISMARAQASCIDDEVAVSQDHRE